MLKKRQTIDLWPKSLNDLELRNFIRLNLNTFSISESTKAPEKYTIKIGTNFDIVIK